MGTEQAVRTPDASVLTLALVGREPKALCILHGHYQLSCTPTQALLLIFELLCNAMFTLKQTGLTERSGMEAHSKKSWQEVFIDMAFIF